MSEVQLARLRGQTMFFDADDTLWENNIYFERAITAFVSYLDHRVHTAEEVREHLNTCEHATIAQYGYGLGSFQRSLVRCFEELAAGHLTPDKHARIVSFTAAIAEQEIELLPGIDGTLPELAQRHTLVLVTKGNDAEQRDKLARSGLAEFFSGVEVLEEKHAAAYRALLSKYAADPQNTWMVGNSPRSDVNPALAAGINAVFIPHDFTWVLEHETIDAPPHGQTLLELNSFASLCEHF